jgi:small subunit ribosomal protein S18
MKKTIPVLKKCYLCENNIKGIDYKDPDLLRRFVSPQGRINAPKRTGCCSKHQRIVSQAVKRARFLALLPYQTR